MSFLFSAGKSNGSSSNTSTANQTQTTTPNVPAWLQDQVTGQSTAIAKLGSMDPYSLVAKANPLQTSAGNAAASLAAQTKTSNFGGWGAGMTRDAGGAAAPSVTAGSLLDNLDKYQNPFQQQVIDASANDFDHQAAMQHAQRALDEAHSGAFGGSGAALATTMGDDNSDRARATLLSGLRSQGFTTAAGLSNQDAQRRQDASTANASLTEQQRALQLQAGAQLERINSDYDANQRANIDSLFSTGTGLRTIDQQSLTAPLDLQAWANQQFGTLPGSLFTGSTTTGSGTTTSNGKTSGTQIGVQLGFKQPGS